MKIIDEKGRLFGKINVIDFLVILFILCLTPMFWFGYKIINRKPPITIAIIKTHYIIKRVCPICGLVKDIEVPIGQLPAKKYEGTCEECGNKVRYIETAETRRR